MSTVAAVRAAAGAVADPELPAVTIGELGMIVGVEVVADRAEVELIPTYSGCPALEPIRQDVERAVLAVAGVGSVQVRLRRDLTWTPQRIAPEARHKLRAFGVAPPSTGSDALPLVQLAGLRCPLCGSRNTVVLSAFGPTPCRDTRYCDDCRNPFEAIKA